MTPQTIQEQLTKYLTDIHSIEQQALAQMHDAPQLAGDEALASAFREHCIETERHEQLIRAQLAARDASPAVLKDIVGTITGKGFAAFAAAQPDTPGKLVAHAYAYEHMEQVAYQLLGLLARQAGDHSVIETARLIEDQEQAMGQRLESFFDRVVELSLEDLAPTELGEQLDKYLADAHAIEEQSVTLLGKSPELAGDSDLAAAYEEHLSETEGHRDALEQRLQARGGSPSKLKDAALHIGALNWGAFFSAQPDTPAKLAGFAYALEHLEIAAYELLRRVAQRAGDQETDELARRILAEERSAAEKVWALLPNALEASLHEQSLR